MKALLVIDVQRKYMKNYSKDLTEKINMCIKKAIQNNEIIIYIKNIRKIFSYMDKNDFSEKLNISSSYIICKKRASAFTEKQLIDILHKNNIDEIDIIGVDGNYCVASTAMDAAKLKFSVTLLCKYIGVRNIDRFNKKKNRLTNLGIKIIEK